MRAFFIACAMAVAAAHGDARAAAASEASVARAVYGARLRAEFRTRIAASRAAVRRCGRDRGCATRANAAREGWLAALAARISDASPNIYTLKGATLVGTWRLGEARSAQGRIEAGGPVPFGKAGSVLRFAPGAICTPGCAPLGLEPDDTPEALPPAVRALFGRDAPVRAYTVTWGGKAEYRLHAAARLAVFVTQTCGGAAGCVESYVPVTPVSAASKLVVFD